MALPADALQTIPDNQLALFLPNQKLIDDYKKNQEVVAVNADALVQAEQDAQDALTASGLAISVLNGTAFLLLGAVPPAHVGQARQLSISADLTSIDTGALGSLTLGLNQKTAILVADIADSIGAFINAGALNAPLAINSTYLVEGMITFQSANVGVGLGVAITLPAGATITGGYSHQATATGSQSAMNLASAAVNANTTAVPVANANTPLIGRWVIKTAGTAGSAQFQFRSGAGGTAVTIKQDLSVVSFRKIA